MKTTLIQKKTITILNHLTSHTINLQLLWILLFIFRNIIFCNCEMSNLWAANFSLSTWIVFWTVTNWFNEFVNYTVSLVISLVFNGPLEESIIVWVWSLNVDSITGFLALETTVADLIVDGYIEGIVSVAVLFLNQLLIIISCPWLGLWSLILCSLWVV